MTAQRNLPLAEIDSAGGLPGEKMPTLEPQPRAIEYLCEPMPVNMGDWWFDIATENHFWIRRRFEVMRRLADSAIRKAARCAEIGCGNGLLQKALEDYYGISVAGFELNEVALRKNVGRNSSLYCYNIHQCNPEFRNYFDMLFLFDVLEHIEDESAFLQSINFHLADSGTLIVNVPAHRFLFSDYDRAQRHVRRYSAASLTRVVEQNGYKVRRLTYWGLPLVPLLLLRKMVSLRLDNGKAGFDPGSRTVNGLLSLLARCEPIPQRMMGTSVMAVLEKARTLE
jgi:SAM-dependent methyltransferase